MSLIDTYKSLAKMFKESTVDSPICLQARDMIEGSACVQIREDGGEMHSVAPDEEREEIMDDDFKERFVQTFDAFVDENPDLIPGSKKEREHLITSLVEVQFEKAKSEKKLREQLESLKAAKSKMEDDLQAEIIKETHTTFKRKEELKAQLVAIYENRQKGEEGMKNGLKLALSGEELPFSNGTKSATTTTNLVNEEDDDYSEFSEEMLRRDYIMELKKDLRHLKTENAALLLEVSKHDQQQRTIISQTSSESTPRGIAADEDVAAALLDKIVLSRDSFDRSNEQPVETIDDTKLDETRFPIPNLENEIKSILTSSTVSSDEDHQLSTNSKEFHTVNERSTTIPVVMKNETKSNDKTINTSIATTIDMKSELKYQTKSQNEQKDNSIKLTNSVEKTTQVNGQTKSIEDTINRIKASTKDSVQTRSQEDTKSDNETICSIISSAKNSVQSHGSKKTNSDDETINSIIASAKKAVETQKSVEEPKDEDETINSILATAKNAVGTKSEGHECEEDGIINSIIDSARREVIQAGEQVEKYDKKVSVTPNKSVTNMRESLEISEHSSEAISAVESDIMVAGTTTCGNSMVCVEEVYEHLNDNEAIISCNDNTGNDFHAQIKETPKPIILNIVSEKESEKEETLQVSDSATKVTETNKEEAQIKRYPVHARPKKEFKKAPEGTFEDMFKFYESQLEE